MTCRRNRKKRIRLEKKIKKLEARKYFVLVILDGSHVNSLDGPFTPTHIKSKADAAIENTVKGSETIIILEMENGKLDWVPYNPKSNDQPNW